MQLFTANTYAIDKYFNDDTICLFMGLDNDLAELIINTTKCPKDRLPIGKCENQDNYEMVYQYCTPEGKYPEEKVDGYADEVNNKILEIGNSFNNLDDFVKFIKDNNDPASIHEQMKESYGLVDEDIEWNVAHFFIQISTLLTGPEFLWTSIEDDIENEDTVAIAVKDGKVTRITSVEEYNKFMEDNNVQ